MSGFFAYQGGNWEKLLEIANALRGTASDVEMSRARGEVLKALQGKEAVNDPVSMSIIKASNLAGPEPT